jgi:hypothetical protein
MRAAIYLRVSTALESSEAWSLRPAMALELDEGGQPTGKTLAGRRDSVPVPAAADVDPDSAGMVERREIYRPQFCRTRLRALAPWNLRVGLSRLQRLEIGDDVLTIVVAGHADDHPGTVNVGGRILQEFVELLIIPGDGSRLECGRIVEPGFGSALAAEYACKRWTNLIHARLGRVADAAVARE